MKAYCSSPVSGQGKLPSGFWTKPVYKKGTGKGAYVQVTGCINPSKLSVLISSDGGGQVRRRSRAL